MSFTSICTVLVAVERKIAAIFMASIVVLVFTGAVMRYLGTPINWSNDLAQAMFVWIVFLGASIATREERHIGVSLFLDMMPPFWQRVATVFGNCIVIMFLAFVVFFGIKVSVLNVNRQLTSIALSYSFVTIAASVGALSMVLTLATRTLRLVCQPSSREGDLS